MAARSSFSRPFPGFAAGLIAISAIVASAQDQHPATSGDKQPPDEKKPAVDPALRDYLSGNGLLNRGLYELAAKEYRKFLEDHADHAKAPLARYGLGVSLFRLDRATDAEVEFKKLSGARFEFSAETAVLLGRCQLLSKEFKSASDSFKMVLSEHAERPIAAEAAAGLIEALYQLEKHDQVLETAEKYADKWPGSGANERIGFYAALSRISKGDHAAAGAEFRKLAEGKGAFAARSQLLLGQCLQQSNKLDEAVEAFQKIVDSDRNEDQPAALSGLGLCYLLKKQPAKSVSTFDRLIKDFPDSAPTGSAQLLRGQALFALEKFAEALADFKKIKRDSPSADTAAYWAAKCLLRMEKNSEAAKRLETAAKDFPKSAILAEMLYDRGVALARDKQNEQAIDTLKDLNEKFPRHSLIADSLDLLATLTHQAGQYADSEKYCGMFLKEHSKHDRAPAMQFLAAENIFLRGEFEKAAVAFRNFVDVHPGDAQANAARARLGLSLYKSGKADDAQRALARIADHAAEDITLRSVLLVLGDLAFERGEWKDARKFLSDYIKQEDAPSADDALLKIGLAYQRESKFADAITSFEQLIEKHPKSPHRLQALFEKGQALTELSRPNDAVTVFEKVVKTDPNSRFAPYALNHLAEIALGKGNLTKAAELFDRVAADDDEQLRTRALARQSEALMSLKKFDEAQAVCKKLLALKPDQKTAAAARARSAIAQARQDHRKEALGEIEKALRSADDLDPELKASLLYEKAWCLRGEKKPAEAAKVYEQLLDAAKDGELHSRVLLEFAEIQSDAGKHERAAELLRRISTEKSSAADKSISEQAAYRLAVCFVNLKKHGEAAAAFAEFLERFPKSHLSDSASLLCGESFFNAAQHEKAIKPLGRAAKVSDRKISAPAQLRLGEAYAALNRWSESQAAFQEYLDHSSDDAQAYQARFGLAWALENLGRHEQAIAAYRRVTEKHQGPTAARAQFQIGECLFATKKYEDAAAELLKVDILYAYPEWSAAALYEAGRCFEALAKNTEAAKQYEIVVEKFKDTRWAKLAQERLAQARTAGIPGRS